MLGIFDEKDYRRLSLLQTSNCSYVALHYSLECLKNALRRNSLLAFAALKQQIKTMIACEWSWGNQAVFLKRLTQTIYFKCDHSLWEFGLFLSEKSIEWVKG